MDRITELTRQPTFQQKVETFIVNWHDFIVDYWWRKKYNIPFGSAAHREMSLIDMCIEYQEAKMIQKAITDREKEVLYEEGGLTQEEIAEDYENLDLDEFDNL